MITDRLIFTRTKKRLWKIIYEKKKHNKFDSIYKTNYNIFLEEENWIYVNKSKTPIDHGNIHFSCRISLINFACLK